MASDHRRERLKGWINGQFGGKVAAFCRHYGLSASMASYLSQLLSGHRAFGERAARSLEAATGRPHGWLDITDDSPPGQRPASLSFDEVRVAALGPGDRELIEAFIDLVLARAEKRQELPDRRIAPLTETRVISPDAATRRTLRAAAERPARSQVVKHHADKGRKRKVA